LNAVAATDPYSLYNESMATNLFIAGIARSGSSGSYSYSVIGPSGTTPAGASSPGNRPITFVSWFDAARFANWMQNGQGSGSTETGAYTLNGATSGSAVAKNAGATVFIPTENEWYKAAYYSPPLNSGSGGYYAFATQSNSDPGNVLGGGANRANYNDGVYSVTQSDRLEGLQNYLTDVGAFTDSASFYGTFDQTGNVFQWNDLDGTAGSSRGLRGGSWLAGVPDNLRSSFRLEFAPTSESDFIGFRLASPVAVPEPSTVALVISGIAAWLWRRRASLGLAMLLLAVSASESRAVETAPSYDIPIYVKNTQQPNNYWIYVSQSASGSNAVPYLFDTGSPNMFTVQGSNTAVAATGTFKFGDGSLFYGYYVAGQSLTLTDSTSTAMTPTVPNFNAAMVVAIDGNTVDNNALADGTYGDFGAGFYGTATLSTLLTAVPLSPGSRLGYVVDVAGITSGTGSLTLGLTPEKITAIQGMPGAIQMAMNLSGQSIQTAGGTTAGYAQGLVTSTVTVNTDRGPASAALPTVFDTGGGPNGVIYYSGSSADPGLFSGVINSGSSARFSLDYQGHVFDAWSGSSPWGGAVAVIPSMSPDVNRVNTGGYLFQNYIVMVDLESATLTLAPV
ncbi:MAG: PEP-CTERM sorting domain-containing protein, partial [Planctomycetia bacterium]|nr:PEP-CTERM sorting domain-containing protein [Planctomycetia bacterium]